MRMSCMQHAESRACPGKYMLMRCLPGASLRRASRSQRTPRRPGLSTALEHQADATHHCHCSNSLIRYPQCMLQRQSVHLVPSRVPLSEAGGAAPAEDGEPAAAVACGGAACGERFDGGARALALRAGGACWRSPCRWAPAGNLRALLRVLRQLAAGGARRRAAPGWTRWWPLQERTSGRTSGLSQVAKEAYHVTFGCICKASGHIERACKCLRKDARLTGNSMQNIVPSILPALNCVQRVPFEQVRCRTPNR